LNGIYVDDDPAQGIIDGRSFIHPDLRLQFTVPVGYLMQNGTRDVTIDGSAGKAQFGGGSYSGDISSYIQRVVYGLTQGKTQVAMSPAQRTTINGIPAAYSIGRAQTSNGVVDVSVMACQWDRNTMDHFITLTRGGQGLQPFASMVESLRRITPAEAAAIRPRIIQVHTVTRGDTAQSLANRMAYRDYKLDRFLSLNGLAANAALVPGQKVKLVVYGSRRA
jgi:predicted Zn-dependent protease